MVAQREAWSVPSYHVPRGGRVRQGLARSRASGRDGPPQI